MEISYMVRNPKIQISFSDVRWRTRMSYLMASRVGSGPSQYQLRVFSVTNSAQVLSSDLVLLKILSRKLYYSRVIYGRRRTAERERLKRLGKMKTEQLKGLMHYDGCIPNGFNMP